MANLRALVAAHTDQVNASRAAAGMPSVEETERVIAEEMGLPNYDRATQKDLFDVANAMHKSGSEAWGFVVVKTWGYKAEERERWDAFWRRWNEIMDARLREMGAVGDLSEGLPGQLLWWLVDHEMMDGKGFKEVKDCFRELVEDAEETIPLGLDLDLCLMIDKQVVDSLLDREETSTALLSLENEKVFVWGVDVNYEDDEDDEDEEEGEEVTNDGEYPGYFKISVNVLIPELWHTLDTQPPDALYPGKGKIYGGIVGNITESTVE